MATQFNPAKTPSRRKSKKVKAQISPEQIAPAPVPEEMRDELTSLMQELLMRCHELSFEYSTSDCDKILECPLAQKSKELFRTVKKLNELVKSYAQPKGKPTYVR